MPTETYHEEAKGISKVWYVYREKIPNRKEIRIHPETFERVKEIIERNGLKLDPKIIPKNTNNYNLSIYILFDANILINKRVIDAVCKCPKHVIPDSYLTITAKDMETLEKITSSLNLPSRERKLHLEGIL